MSLFSGYKVNKAIDTLLNEEGGVAWETSEAIAKLKDVGAPAIPKLVEALAGAKPDSGVRKALAGMLGNDTLPAFISGLAHKDTRVVSGVTRILEASGTYDVNRLFDFMDHPDIPHGTLVQVLEARKHDLDASKLLKIMDKVPKSVRPLVFRLVEEAATPEMAGDVFAYTKSKDPSIRLQAVKILGNIDTEPVRDTLLGLMTDSNKQVRQAALQGLGGMTVEVPINRICEVLRDPDLTVQAAAIEALCRLHAPETLRHLLDILQDESEYVRRAAVEVLNEVGDQHAIQDLLNALRDKDWWVKVRAADALGTIGGPKVVEVVLALLKDDDEFLRRTAVEILNTLEDDKSFGFLVEALKDKDWWVRERAADALAKLGDKRALAALLQMFRGHPESAKAALRAVSKLEDSRAIRPLLENLEQNPVGVNKEILNALRELTDHEHVGLVQEAVSRLMRTSDPELKTLAGATLNDLSARFGGSQAEAAASVTTTENESSNGATRYDLPAGAVTQYIDAAELTPGQVLGDRYRVIKKVGEGGFGKVVLVEDMAINEEIILKFLNPQLAADENMIKRFIHELRYARKITHENVIRIYDFITFGKSSTISMEYFDSHSLGAELKGGKRLDIARGVQIMIEVCKGLAVAHRADVVHRDIKPANILIDDNDVVKIVDFGLAAAASGGESRLTRSGILIGTPQYMAPEQIQGGDVDACTDIYSLGILMYHAFVGKPPYTADEPVAILFKHVEGKAQPPRELNPDIPEALQAVILKAMTNKKEARYQDVGELQAALESVVESLGTS